MAPPQTATTAAVPPAAPAQLDFFVQFEVWNQSSMAFVTLPAGVSIDLTDHNPVMADQPVDSQTTDAQGTVHFAPTRATVKSKSGEDKPDLYFLAHSNGVNVSGVTIPKDWSTKGWQDKTGKPGYYPSYAGNGEGSAAQPLVFRIGFDFHVRLQYKDLSNSSQPFAPSPKGVPINLSAINPNIYNTTGLRTDSKGEIHGVVFDIDPGLDLFFQVSFEIEDASINLPKASFEDKKWATSIDDADKKTYPKYASTSIGTQSSPDLVQCTLDQRNIALYFLKILYELAVFLFNITGGDYPGVTDLELFPHCISGDSNAYSWPVGSVNLGANHHWKRDTLIHENGHQVMWKEANFTSLGVGYEAVFGKLCMTHYEGMYYTQFHALVEGWAEFLEAVFAATTDPPYQITNIYDSDQQNSRLLMPPNDNIGEKVEGAFASAMWRLFKDIVVGSASTSAHIAESINGNILDQPGNSWISDAGVKSRFLTLVWGPLKDLSSLSSPTSTDFIGKIKTRNGAQWHQVIDSFQGYNLAMYSPTLTSVAPNSGPQAGGQTITLVGDNFSATKTEVTIGGTTVIPTVTAGGSLTVSTPTGTGSADVVVKTPAGTATLSGGYTYATKPQIQNVTPRTGSAAGGDTVIITGSAFQDGLTVRFGATVATIVSSTPTRIQVTTPPLPIPRTSGAVDVTVENPGGLSDSVTGGYEYTS